MIDVTFFPPWGWAWRYGTGAFDAGGNVSANSSSAIVGSNFDGAGVGAVFDVTTERQLFVISRLSAVASSEAVGIWGWASAEPMFDLWLRGMSPATDVINNHYEVGIEMRAVAPVFGLVALRNQTRTAEPTLSLSRQFPVQPGPVFAGAGVKTYAGTGGFFCGATSSIRTVVRSIRVVAW